jgi:hypothetical protein
VCVWGEWVRKRRTHETTHSARERAARVLLLLLQKNCARAARRLLLCCCSVWLPYHAFSAVVLRSATLMAYTREKQQRVNGERPRERTAALFLIKLQSCCCSSLEPCLTHSCDAFETVLYCCHKRSVLPWGLLLFAALTAAAPAAHTHTICSAPLSLLSFYFLAFNYDIKTPLMARLRGCLGGSTSMGGAALRLSPKVRRAARAGADDYLKHDAPLLDRAWSRGKRAMLSGGRRFCLAVEREIFVQCLLLFPHHLTLIKALTGPNHKQLELETAV